MRTLGIDIGSTAVKGVLLDFSEGSGDGRIDPLILPTGWNPKASGAKAVAKLLDRNGLTRADIARLVATGYGRNLVEADAAVTEITCHALGVRRLFDGFGIRTVLDIGGQDSKTIALDSEGNVLNFLMNDKCAAGTGRFLQNMAVMLGWELEDFDLLPEVAVPHPISCMCTVFAESEIVGLLAQGTDKSLLALGILDSVASRAEGMLRRVGLNAPVAFTGGTSRSRSLVHLLEKRLGQNIAVSEYSQFAGALGAAEIARRQLQGPRAKIASRENSLHRKRDENEF